MTFPLAANWATGNSYTAAAQNNVETVINNIGKGTQVIPEAVTVAATALTLTTANSCYVFTGSSGVTWTLPAVAGNTGVRLKIDNRGTAGLTVQAAGSDSIFLGGATNASLIMGPSASIQLVNDGTYWNVLQPTANFMAGILPVTAGGTAQAASITGLIKGNGTSPMTAVTAPAGAVVGTTDTQTLSGKTLTTPVVTGYTETVQAMGTVGASATIPALSGGTMITALLTAGTTTTFTMPAAAAGQSFCIAVQQAATPTGVATFTGVLWPNAAAPVITTTASYFDIITFFCFDGSHWRGSYAQGYSA